jgi:hypothetical protein
VSAATTPEKIDLFREHRDEYAMAKSPTVISVGRGRYLAVTGTGSPEGSEFQRRLGALYGCAYTIKFAAKAKGRDFKVGVLEGLWWGGSGAASPFAASKANWRWKLLIRVPDFVSERDVRSALKTLRLKKGVTDSVTLETISEGRSVQMLHVGPYGDEPRTIAAMDELARSRHLRYRGAHHEIYLSDPRRVKPERLRTIIRHPVASRAYSRSIPSHPVTIRPSHTT